MVTDDTLHPVIIVVMIFSAGFVRRYLIEVGPGIVNNLQDLRTESAKVIRSYTVHFKNAIVSNGAPSRPRGANF